MSFKFTTIIKKIGMGMALAASLVMIGSISAKADVIAEPYGDDFYNHHKYDCQYDGSMYCANGPDGQVTLYISPVDSTIVGTVKNGDNLCVDYLYEADGVIWGLVEYHESGWVPMPYMDHVYGENDFWHTYSFLFEDTTDVSLAVTADQPVVNAFMFPGSKDYYELDTSDIETNFSLYFADDNGHTWGCLEAMYHGMSNRWICLDQPYADYDELYSEGTILEHYEYVPREYTGDVIVPGTPSGGQGNGNEMENRNEIDNGGHFASSSSAAATDPAVIIIVVGGVVFVALITVFLLILLKVVRKKDDLKRQQRAAAREAAQNSTTETNGRNE